MDFYKCKTCGLIANKHFKTCPSCENKALKTKVLVDEIQVPCPKCGCYENESDLKEGMCEDCYEEWLEDCKEDEEE